MPKKITVTVTNDLIQDQRMHRICSTMQKEGYDVVLIGRKKRKSSETLDFTFEQYRIKCFFESSVFFYIEFNIRLFFYLLSSNSDAFYSVDLDTIIANGIVSRLKRKPHIHDAHEYFVEVPELVGKTIKQWVWNRIGASFIPRASLAFTVNLELAKVLSQKYGNDFQVVRSVPELIDRGEIKIHEEPKVILYQGVLNQGRGLEEAIQAIAEMKEDIVLLIAGEGDLSQELRALKREIDHNNKVKFLGWKTPQELLEVTSTAWVGLNLLDSRSLNYAYSLSNKFFGYMHEGVPSINMNFPVYRRYCGEYGVGILIDSLDPAQIKNSIRELRSDAAQYNQMKMSCEQARLKFNWQNESKHLASLIKQVVG